MTKAGELDPSTPTFEGGAEKRTPLEVAKTVYLKDFTRACEFGLGIEIKSPETKQTIQFIGNTMMERILNKASELKLSDEEQQILIESMPKLDQIFLNLDDMGEPYMSVRDVPEDVDKDIQLCIVREFARASLLLKEIQGNNKSDRIRIEKYHAFRMYNATLVADGDKVHDSIVNAKRLSRPDGTAYLSSQYLTSRDDNDTACCDKDSELFADLMIAKTGYHWIAKEGGSVTDRLSKVARDSSDNFLREVGAQVAIGDEHQLVHRRGHKIEDIKNLQLALERYSRSGEDKYETPDQIAEKARSAMRALQEERSISAALSGRLSRTAKDRDDKAAELELQKIKGGDDLDHLRGAEAGLVDYEAQNTALKSGVEDVLRAIAPASEKPGPLGGNAKEALKLAIDKLQALLASQ